MWSDFFLEVAKAVLPFVGMAVTAAVATGAEYIRQRARSEIVRRAMDSARHVTKAAVLEAQQTAVVPLKESNGGNLTESEAEAIKQDVIDAVHERLAEETKKQLALVIDDLEGYFGSLIERYIYEHKEAVEQAENG